jgi:hydrogenase/urease accessory protein HupE
MCGLFVRAPTPPLTHDLILRYGPFLGHALHFCGEINHVVAFAVVGVLIGQNKGTVRQDGVFAFLFALVAGMFAPQAWTPEGAFPILERFASPGGILVVGSLVIVARPLSSGQLALITGLTGAIHGIAAGLVVSASTQWLSSTLGALVASFSIAGIGLIIATKADERMQRAVFRIAGIVAVALGLVLLGASAKTAACRQSSLVNCP